MINLAERKIESECLIENMYIGLLVAYSAVREVLMHDGMSSNRIHLSWTLVRVYLVPLAVSFFGCCLSVRGSQTAAPAGEQKIKDKNDGHGKPESASLCMQKFVNSISS